MPTLRLTHTSAIREGIASFAASSTPAPILSSDRALVAPAMAAPACRPFTRSGGWGASTWATSLAWAPTSWPC
jgi:hypothetical protein